MSKNKEESVDQEKGQRCIWCCQPITKDFMERYWDKMRQLNQKEDFYFECQS